MRLSRVSRLPPLPLLPVELDAEQRRREAALRTVARIAPDADAPDLLILAEYLLTGALLCRADEIEDEE